MDKNKKIVKGEVKEIKDNEVKKFFRSLFADDIKSVVPNVIQDAIIPKTKGLIVDVLQTLVARIFGSSKTASTRPGLGGVSYSQYYINQQNRTSSYINVPEDRESVRTVTLQEIHDRNEAEEVLQEMKNTIEMYGHVKVSEYFDLLGKRATHTDEKWGWRNLDGVVVKPTVDGYILTLPPAIPLNIKQL